MFIPVLFIAAALSYPYQAVVGARLRRGERRFEAEMSAAKRTMAWDGSPHSLANRGGTLVEEWFGPKGPVRWWWTEDDIGAISPYQFTDDPGLALFDETYDALSA